MRPALILAFIILVAGCASFPGGSTSDTQAPTPTPPTTTAATPDSPSSPTATAIPEDQILDYDKLWPEAQQLFDRARTNGSLVLEATRPPWPYREYEYVRYEGSLYHVTTEEAGAKGLYGLKPERINASDIPDDETPSNFSNLSYRAQTVIRQAIVEGEYESPQKPYPEFLSLRYVRFNSTYYDMGAYHADIFLMRLNVTMVDQ